MDGSRITLNLIRFTRIQTARSIDFSAPTSPVSAPTINNLDINETDQRNFAARFRADVKSARQLFTGSRVRDDDGFFGRFKSLLKGNLNLLGIESGSTGVVVDAFA